jgi:multicomponent Na+:H+ antiporter subunit F
MITTLIFGGLILAMLLAFVQLVRGPNLPSRVVALDLMATLSVGFIATYAVATEEAIYLDVAMVLALIAFLGTVAFASYTEKGNVPWERQ